MKKQIAKPRRKRDPNAIRGLSLAGVIKAETDASEAIKRQLESYQSFNPADPFLESPVPKNRVN